MRAARRSCWAAILAHVRAWLVAPRPDLATLDRLLGLVQQRLTLMHEAARWNWNAGQPVTDPKRERELLQSIVDRSRGRGAEPKLVRHLPKNRRSARRCDRPLDASQFGQPTPVRHTAFSGSSTASVAYATE